MKTLIIKPQLTVIALLSAMVLIIQSCSHADELNKNGKVSAPNEESHNAGKNCMSCHNNSKNEASEYWWNIAGTVYDNNKPAANEGSIELWTEQGRKGKLLTILPIDKEGNFYTEKIVNFQGGFYPVIVKDNQILNQMSSKTSEGSCNSCHGVTQEKIEIN